MFVKILGYFVLVCFLLQLALVPVSSEKINVNAAPRIVGGTAVEIAKVPHLLQVWKNGRFHCGASLVTKFIAISAAHCFVGGKEEQFTIVGGATTLSQTGVRRKVLKITLPKTFNMRTLNSDVAVIKLAEAMEGPNISTIELNTVPIRHGLLMQVSGWGLTSETGVQVSQQARTVQVAVIAKQKCRRQYSKPLTSTMFCAARPGKKDACSGDSGGPAVCGNKLCGIVSWGIGCARRRYPGVYTGVLAMRTFIENAMKQ